MAQKHHLTHPDLLVLHDGVGNVNLVRVISMPADIALHLRIQISAIQIDGKNLTAVIRQTFRREGRAGVSLKPARGREFVQWNACISFNLH